MVCCSVAQCARYLCVAQCARYLCVAVLLNVLDLCVLLYCSMCSIFVLLNVLDMGKTITPNKLNHKLQANARGVRRE